MTILNRFQQFFGDPAGLLLPGNIGESRTIASLCREALLSEGTVLFEYFRDWHEQDNPHVTDRVGVVQAAQHFQRIGQWEAAWLLLQVHVDQTQKYEVETGVRQHKGDPLCGLAILGRDFPSPALARHYAQLSSAGDLYQMHAEPSLQHGGFAPTIMERYESTDLHLQWRAQITPALTADQTPLYLEPFLASRWFSPALAQHFLNMASPVDASGKPFIERLLDVVDSPPAGTSATTTGTRFEAASGLLLSLTPGFEVHEARRTDDQQIDLVVTYQRDLLSRLPLAEGPGLVECKSETGAVSAAKLREFGMKCILLGVKFGILISRLGVTGSAFVEPRHAAAVRRNFLSQGLKILVVKMPDLRNKSHNLRGLQDVLLADHNRLVFGPIADETQEV